MPPKIPICALLHALVLTLAVAPALAQPGDRGPSTISTRDLTKMGEILDLTEDQQTLSETLYEGYVAQSRAAASAFQEKMRAVREKARETRDPSLFRSLRDDMEAYGDLRDQLEETFLSDVRMLLTPAQAEQWPRIERALRRWHQLRRGFIQGEHVDLIAIVDDLSISSPDVESRLAPVLEQYAKELDQRLRARMEAYEEAWSRFSELRQSGEMDKLEVLMNDGREASLEVREVNVRFTDRVARILPEDARADFQHRVQLAAYPQVYEPTNADRGIQAAQGFSDLTPDQADRIASLRTTLSREMESVNARMVEAIESGEEEEITVETMFRRRNRRGLWSPAIRELREEKEKVVQGAVDDLHAILSEAQIARLPKDEPQSDDRPRWGGGG